MSLIEEIEIRRTSFKSESYSMSLGELVNLYENNEIIIRPEYQRLFRWTHGQKVKLVESIILGIPIPSIFVYQSGAGIWELVDGLQRVSTVLQLFGVLRDEDGLILNGTKHLPSLEGYKWTSDNPDNELPGSIKLAIKRAKINVTIILSESDDRAKFEVFQRLNTGGSNASNQEIRNNIMIMIDPAKFTWFNQLGEDQAFQETLALTERLFDEQYHLELLLRFIGLSFFGYDNKKDVGDFLDDINDKLLNDQTINFDQIEDNFLRTFQTLQRILGEKAFKRYSGDNFKGKFLESAFEAVSIGLGANIDSYDLPTEDTLLHEKIKNLYTQAGYQDTSGSGSNAKVRIPKLIPFAKDYFRK